MRFAQGTRIGPLAHRRRTPTALRRSEHSAIRPLRVRARSVDSVTACGDVCPAPGLRNYAWPARAFAVCCVTLLGCGGCNGWTDESRLFAEIYPTLRRFAAAVTSLDADPDDLVQEAVVRALRRGALSDLDDATSFLCRIIVNLARNHHRDTARRTAILRRSRPDTSTSDVYPSEFIDLSRLTVDQRAVVFLRFVEQATTHDIAVLLDLREDAVRSRISRALKALRIEAEEQRTKP